MWSVLGGSVSVADVSQKVEVTKNEILTVYEKQSGEDVTFFHYDPSN